ncbi:hypothetical protein H8E77_07565 [bacterium]|nr:hypothetical protein [bacterium]
MIKDDTELMVTLNRIERFQKQIAQLRNAESNQENYLLSAGGFLSEIDRMQLEVREYLMVHPSELKVAEAAT